MFRIAQLTKFFTLLSPLLFSLSIGSGMQSHAPTSMNS